MINYVKFLKGTPSAFSALQSKDKDTFYFIAEENASYGKLYLGDILIAGDVASDDSSFIDSLEELATAIKAEKDRAELAENNLQTTINNLDTAYKTADTELTKYINGLLEWGTF